MDFSIFSNTRFKAGIDLLHRSYEVKQLRSGLIEIRNMISGFIAFTLNFDDITIDGNPLVKLDDLQAIVYNRECLCDISGDDDYYMGIFDNSFDKTFE